MKISQKRLERKVNEEFIPYEELMKNGKTYPVETYDKKEN